MRSNASIELHPTWQAMPPEAAQGRAAVVVDALRATTTLTAMIAAGAEAVLPVADLAVARNLKAEAAEIILAGERGNHPPPGFDGGNSPREYPPERVRGRRIVLTTTNGTQAVLRAERARRMAAGALVNAGAVADWIREGDEPPLFVLAGSQGAFALEDLLAAGAVIDRLRGYAWSDAARAAWIAYDRYRGDLVQGLLDASHGAELAAQGLGEDLQYAASLDRFQVVAARGPDGWFRRV